MNITALLTIIISIVSIGIFIGVGFLIVKTRKEDEEEKYWKEAYKKADKFIEKLNLQQKINLLYGTENMKEITPIVPEKPYKTKDEQKQWLCVGKIDNDSSIGFNGMCLQDGPAGIRFANGTAISYQASSNTAATFNKTLFRLIGESQGEECKARGINVLLGPSVNMMRCPQAGRGWEAFGEDPYLAGVTATEVIKGIQSKGVIASLKHFVGNDQETYRKASSSNMDMPTLMDIYVEPFYRAIRYGHVGSIMAAYNAINNTYCYESKLILTHILREICGFQGFVVSDWWEVVSNTTATIEAGLDMNMPGGYDEGPYGGDLYQNYGRDNSYWAAFPKYVKEGKLSEDAITRAATRIIAAMYQMDQMDSFPPINLYVETKTQKRTEIQKEAAIQSQVLLKNQNNTLPLNVNQKIAIIGSDAKNRDNCKGEGDFQCLTNTNKVYDGHMPLGYGSGTTTFGYLKDPLTEIKNKLSSSGKTLKVSTDLKFTKNITQTENDGTNTTITVEGIEDIDKATALFANVQDVDVAIIFLSADSGEEYTQLEGTIGDRPNLDVFHQGNELVDAICNIKETSYKKAGKDLKIVVVINSPSAVNVPWKDQVDAILYSGFPGAESGTAITNILFGDDNPSGHLPFTWAEMKEYGANIPELENLNEIRPGVTWKAEYRYNGIDSDGLQDNRENHDIHQVPYEDGLYIGQRWFNKFNKKPIYPFGFGLSYTTFTYSGLSLEMKSEGGLYATFTVKNTGKMKGQAVPMLFLTFPDYIGEYPKYILKGFEKVELLPNESKKVTINSDEHALSYFNLESDNYDRVCKDKIKVYIAEDGDPNNYKLNGEVKAEC